MTKNPNRKMDLGLVLQFGLQWAGRGDRAVPVEWPDFVFEKIDGCFLKMEKPWAEKFSLKIFLPTAVPLLCKGG